MGLYLHGEPVFVCLGEDRHYYGTLLFEFDVLKKLATEKRRIDNGIIVLQDKIGGAKANMEV